jgi:hypothetical protein
MMNEMKIGSEVTDGFEEGIIVSFLIEEGVDMVCVSDGKEGWIIEASKLKLVEYVGGDVLAKRAEELRQKRLCKKNA